MENQNNTTQATTPVPGFTRKTVLRPKTESSAPETKKEPIQEADSDFTEACNIIANNGEEPTASEAETAESSHGPDMEETDEWESFMENLRNYESRGCRENRTYCRLDNDIADALYELDINGSSRPDIVSAVMRGFLLRNKERLLQLRRARKSFLKLYKTCDMKRQWTDSHTEMLRELYPVETIERTAEIIGFSRTTIKVKARKFGIVKGMNVEWLDKATVVRNNFDSHSFAEIADMIGATKTTVARIAGKLGLRRTRKENRHIRSRVRKDMVKREKRRVIFGFDPVTRIKVVTNRRRIRLRAELKAAGYIVERMANILYFKSEDCRNLNKENIASRHGLRFAPWPYEEEPLVNAI